MSTEDLSVVPGASSYKSPSEFPAVFVGDGNYCLPVPLRSLQLSMEL